MALCCKRVRRLSELSAIGLATIALPLLMNAGPLTAQQDPIGPGVIALAGGLGRHAFGIGAEFSLHRRIALSLRTEGWPYSTFAVGAAGVRVNVTVERAGFVYAQAAIGEVQCTRVNADAANTCIDHEWHGALNVNIGAELVLTDDYSWSAGVEAGYWAARHRADAHVDHLSFAAIIRYRSPDLRR